MFYLSFCLIAYSTRTSAHCFYCTLYLRISSLFTVLIRTWTWTSVVCIADTEVRYLPYSHTTHILTILFSSVFNFLTNVGYSPAMFRHSYYSSCSSLIRYLHYFSGYGTSLIGALIRPEATWSRAYLYNRPVPSSKISMQRARLTKHCEDCRPSTTRPRREEIYSLEPKPNTIRQLVAVTKVFGSMIILAVEISLAP